MQDQGSKREPNGAADTGRAKSQPTVNDVASDAGVSRQTVSNVLRRPEVVRPETAARVLASIERLDYRTHRSASMLRLRTSLTIGYPLPNMVGEEPNVLLDAFLHHVCQAAEAVNHHILLLSPAPGDFGPYDDLIRASSVSGYILSETEADDPRARHLMDRKIPFVTFGRTSPREVGVPIRSDHDLVDVDGAAGTASAVHHLAAQGRRNIGFVGWPRGSLAGDDRYNGYLLAMAELGCDADPDLVWQGSHRGLGTAAMNAWLQRGTPVDGVVCVSDRPAVELMQAARSAGRTIGPDGDLSVIGFDDEPMARFAGPPLTTLRQPIDRVARALVERLVKRINDPSAPIEPTMLQPELVVRASA